MDQSLKDKLLGISKELIAEGGDVAASRFETDDFSPTTCVDIYKLHRWLGKVRSFGHQLGAAAKPWEDIFAPGSPGNALTFVERVRGTLEAIQHELENGHLDTFSQLVRAETFADLLEQSEHLLENGDYLAAGVIGRAVLEEHLRTTCETLGCPPPKQRPTINDFNQSLYGVEHYNRIKMKQIDTLAAIGNDAAHNKPDLDPADIEKLLSDLPAIIESTSA
jgi:hypothetical protein